MIKNILFDLSEVIISGYYGMELLMEKKYNISAEEFIDQKQKSLNIFLDAMRGKMTEEQYWQELLKRTNWNITIKDLKTTIRENLNQPIKGTLEIVKSLKGRYRLILLSDHVKEWMNFIKGENKDIRIFDQMIFSYELGSLKTDSQTFMEVLRQNQLVAQETVFIDDCKENIEKAEEVGIYGILFRNEKQLKEELDKKYQIQV